MHAYFSLSIENGDQPMEKPKVLYQSHEIPINRLEEIEGLVGLGEIRTKTFGSRCTRQPTPSSTASSHPDNSYTLAKSM